MKFPSVFFKALYKTTFRLILSIIFFPVLLVVLFLAVTWSVQIYMDVTARIDDGPQWREKRVERQPYLAYEDGKKFKDAIHHAQQSGAYDGIDLEIDTDDQWTEIIVALEFMRKETPAYYSFIRNNTSKIVEDNSKGLPWARGTVTYMPTPPKRPFDMLRPEGTASILVHEAVHHTQGPKADMDDTEAREREAFAKQTKFLKSVNASKILIEKFEIEAESWTVDDRYRHLFGE